MLPSSVPLRAFATKAFVAVQQLRRALADRPGDLAALVDREVVVHDEVLEDLRVELGLVAVEDHRGDHADVDELHEIVVLERLVRRDDRQIGGAPASTRAAFSATRCS